MHVKVSPSLTYDKALNKKNEKKKNLSSEKQTTGRCSGKVETFIPCPRHDRLLT